MFLFTYSPFHERFPAPTSLCTVSICSCIFVHCTNVYHSKVGQKNFLTAVLQPALFLTFSITSTWMKRTFLHNTIRLIHRTETVSFPPADPVHRYDHDGCLSGRGRWPPVRHALLLHGSPLCCGTGVLFCKDVAISVVKHWVIFDINVFHWYFFFFRLRTWP